MNLTDPPNGSKDPHLAERLASAGASLEMLLAETTGAGAAATIAAPLLLETAQNYSQEVRLLLDLVYKSLEVSIAYMDRDFNFIRVNRAYAEASNLPPEAFIGKNHFEMFPGAQARAIFESVAASGQPYSVYASPFQNPINPASGITYWDWTLQPLKNNQGAVNGLLLVLVDVTRPTRTELALKKRSNLLQLVHEIAVASNDALSVEGILQFAVDRICAYTAWPVGHALLKDSIKGLISTHLWHLEPGQDWTPFKQVSDQADWNRKIGLPGRVIASGAPAWFEDLSTVSEFTRPNEARQCGLKSSFAFPILIASEPAGVLEFFNTQQTPADDDLLKVMASMGAQLGRVIERVRFSNALERSEARFRAIFDESALGIQINDLSGNFIESNPALRQMLGYDAEELRHLALTEIVHPDDLPRTWQSVRQLVNGEREQSQDVTRYIRKDRSLVWTQQVVSLVRDDDGPQFLIFLVNDITETRRMEADLSELQRRLFDSVENERLRLASVLHDGPLQDLYGASFQLLDSLPDLKGSQVEDRVANSQAIVQQVISSLRVICGDLRPPTLAPFGLEKAIRAHAVRVQSIHSEPSIHLDLFSDGGVFNEQGRMILFRAYQQLISNAVRHSEAQNIWVRLRLDADNVVLEIEDDGRGFVPPARWLDLAREGRMGLVGVSERAEDYGGRLEIDTNPGAGSILRVVMPRERVTRGG